MTHRISILLLIVAAAMPALARAQAPSDAARAESRRHFERGVQLFVDGNNVGALIEFEAANAAAPNFRVLYNIGNVHVALRHAVEAVEAYERYLWEGGESLPADRRREVEAALAEQRQNIGTVMITSNVEGATVTLNGVDTVHTLPLAEPLRLSIGQYAIGLRLPGRDGPTPTVTVSSQSEQTIEIEMTELVEAHGNLAITASVPDVEIFLDGASVGTTPLPEDPVVAPGEHEVIGRRAGYVESRQRVTTQDNGQHRVDLSMERDPSPRREDVGSLALELPDAPSTLRVDGESLPLTRGRAELPVGRHGIEIDVENREAYRAPVVVSAERELSMRPELTWTPAVRLDKLQDANFRSTLGVAVGIGGVVTALVGGVVLIWNEARDNRGELEADYLACRPGSGLECSLERQINELEYKQLDNDVPLFRLWGSIPLGIGVAAATVGALFFFTAPSAEDIDAEAHAQGLRFRVVPGLGDVSIVGTF